MLSNILFKAFKLLIGLALGLVMLVGGVHAAVEVNSAEQSALESVRGLGPSKAKAILAERKKNGPFKDSNDLHTRVKGIGEKTVERLMKNGLTVNSKGLAEVDKAPSTKGDSKRGVKKEAKQENTREAKKENQKEIKKPSRKSNKEES
ncbi:helix-hairpin-helix domain-containing protein [Polynucleobacter sp. 30F-ANTBAC]|jgi:competence protein ComEA|uniref:ComEA family DNA-binding protein n=1 Tax=Polynucleobacter sp. 30F-ANTBAC TaxID=2689095 RepID=UPI001C0CCCAC|nr:helix-hairpin-helix domain-containing protein [Polynucleobacter sp. 30F-ANTBAC]